MEANQEWHVEALEDLQVSPETCSQTAAEEGSLGRTSYFLLDSWFRGLHWSVSGQENEHNSCKKLSRGF